MSYAIAFIDLTNNNFVHWVLWNIPGTLTSLAAGIDRTTAMPDPPGGSAQQAGLGSGRPTTASSAPARAATSTSSTIYALSVPTFSPTQATNQTMVRTQLIGARRPDPRHGDPARAIDGARVWSLSGGYGRAAGRR